MVEHVLQILGDAVDPWAYPAVFVATALEASALVGLVVPGETVLLLAGFLAYQGRLGLWLLMGLAACGAVAGDSAGYELGRRYGRRLEGTWAGRKIGSTRWERARTQIRHRGPQAVLVGRFVGVLRAVVPAAAGDAGMPYGSFLVWNVLGALVWAPLVVGLGYLVGESYDEVARYMGWGSIGIVAALVVGAVAWRLVRRRRREDRS